jgi:hypothetical protein
MRTPPGIDRVSLKQYIRRDAQAVAHQRFA